MARGKSVVQGEEYWGASYLKGLSSGNHFCRLNWTLLNKMIK